MIKHLIDHQGLGSHKGDTVVFGGYGKAGAIGSMVHLDKVAERLESLGLNVLGLHDSPLDIDVEPLYPDTIKGENITDDMLY